MSKYLRSRSIPVKALPRFAQATPVVPLPMNGSQTVSAPGTRLKHQTINRAGFCVGCSAPSVCISTLFAVNARVGKSKLVHASSPSLMVSPLWPLSQNNHPFVGCGNLSTK